MEGDHHLTHKINWSSSPSKHYAGFQKCLSSSDFKVGIEGEKEGNENERPQEIVNKEQRKSFMSKTISSSSKKKNKKILTDKNEPIVDFDRIPRVQNSNLGPNRNSGGFLPPVKPDVDEGNDLVFAPAGSRPYDPTTNYLSPRPKFLRYNPDRSRAIFLRIEREKRNLGGDGSDTSHCSSSESEDLNQDASFFESPPPPPLDSPEQQDESSPFTDNQNSNLANKEVNLENEDEDESSPSTDNQNSNLANKEVNLQNEEEDESSPSTDNQNSNLANKEVNLENEEEDDDEDDDIYIEEKGSSICSLVWKSMLLLGVLFLSTYSILQMSSSPASSFVQNRRESRVNYLDFYLHVQHSDWNLKKLCPKPSLEVFIELPATCPNLQFKDSVTLGKETKEDLQFPEVEESHAHFETVSGHSNEIQIDETLELKVEEDSNVEEPTDEVDLVTDKPGILGENRDRFGDLDGTVEWEQENQRETDEAEIEKETKRQSDEEFPSLEEEMSSFSVNHSIESTISPRKLVRAILALVATVITGILFIIVHNKKKMKKNHPKVSLPSSSKSDRVEASGLTSSEKKEKEENKVEFSPSENISHLNASIGKREIGIYQPTVELLGEFSIAEAETNPDDKEEVQSPLSQVKKNSTVNSMSSSKDVVHVPSSEFSTAESNSYGRATVIENLSAKKKKASINGEKDDQGEMTPVRRSTRIRKQIYYTP